MFCRICKSYVIGGTGMSLALPWENSPGILEFPPIPLPCPHTRGCGGARLSFRCGSAGSKDRSGAYILLLRRFTTSPTNARNGVLTAPLARPPQVWGSLLPGGSFINWHRWLFTDALRGTLTALSCRCLECGYTTTAALGKPVCVVVAVHRDSRRGTRQAAEGCRGTCRRCTFARQS